MSKRKRRKSPRHVFLYRIEMGDGTTKTLRGIAKVLRPRHGVRLALKAEHVRESMHLKGVGNTQTCSMAICGKSQKEAFSHRVVGDIDWTYSRAYVASRRSAATGLPSEC